MRRMQECRNRLNFKCPLCENKFDLDQTYGQIGEYQLVNCPECLANLVTVKKDAGIELEHLEC